MKRLLNICSLQLKEKYSLFLYASKLRKLIYLFISVSCILIITLIAQMLYNTIISHFILYPINHTFLATVITFASLISIVFIVFSFLTKTYYSRDKTIFMVLPVTNVEIYSSKVLTIVVCELINSLYFILPLILGFGLVIKAGITFYLLIIIVLPLIVLINVGISMILVIPIIYLLKLFNRNNIIALTTMAIAMIVILVLYMSLLEKIFISFDLVGSTTTVVLKIKAFLSSIYNNVFIYRYICDLIFNKSVFLNIVLILTFIFLFFSIGIILNLLLYSNLISFVTKKKKIYNYNFKSSKNMILKIIKKEYLLLIRNPSYIFQFFIFVIVSPTFVYTYNRLLSILELGNLGKDMLVGANILLLSLFSLLSCTYSATSISREGKNFYLLKISSTDFIKHGLAKMIFNFIIVVFSLFVSILLVVITGYLNVLNGLLIFIATSLLLAGHIIYSFESDLKKPFLDWYDKAEISEHNNGSSKSVSRGIILGSILGMVSLLIIPLVGLLANYIILFLFTTSYFLIRAYLLKSRCLYYFDRLEV